MRNFTIRFRAKGIPSSPVKLKVKVKAETPKEALKQACDQTPWEKYTWLDIYETTVNGDKISLFQLYLLRMGAQSYDDPLWDNKEPVHA